MKKHRFIITLLLTISLLLANTSSAKAMPPLPSAFYGTVKINGANVPAGSIVSAWINGVQYAQATVSQYEGDTVYSISVPGDDSASPGVIEGGVEGDTIVFRIGDHVADQTGTWHEGTNIQRNLTATVTYTLTVTKAGAGSGTVTSSPSGISCGSDCEESYNENTVVTLTASASTGSNFTGWSGACSGTASTCQVTMSTARSVTATFTINTYILTITKAGAGSGTVTSSPSGISCGSDCAESYDYNTVVTLTAAASAGSTFTGWSGAGCSGTGTCQVIMSTGRSVTATFTLNTYLLTISKDGSGDGTVTSSPSGISCGSDCAESYAYNTVVTLTAAASAGSTFTGWSGAGCSGTGTCQVTMTTARSVTATFTLNNYTLTVSTTGAGSGTVTSNPAGINCGSDCSESYNEGTVVTLTAAASTGSTFTGWGGSCSGTESTCQVTMTAARSVTAAFTLNTFTLTVSTTGSGTGTVTSNPAGINCGSDCSQDYTYNTLVTLTANASTGSTFTGWSGAGCSGTGTCQVTMTAARSVTATFTLGNYVLSVSKAGTGSGTVTSSPSGISCGSDCSESYEYNTVVTLTAAASTGSNFTGWSGACSGTASTCQVTMTTARSVTATFTINTYTLSVSKTGAGSGTVTSSPPGISCGSDCAESYDYDTVVTLNATASTGSTFSGWSGACSGTASTCQVTMTAARSVLAAFTLNTYTLTVSTTGAGSGTVTSSPPGISCGSDCSESYEYNTVVTLTAAASAGSTFSGWSGACSGTASTCQVTMTTARSVTATFNPANDPPVITEGSTINVTMSEDGSPTAFNLTLHATDEDEDPLTWSISDPADHGTATASGTGPSKAIGYAPTANYNGADSFVVQVSDGNGGTDTITVNVTIQPVNDAPVANAQSVITPEDTARAITLTGSDVDGNPLIYTIVAQPTHGVLSGTAPNVTYTPNQDYNGVDSFTFKVNDGTIDSNTATVSITVSPVNDTPTTSGIADVDVLEDALNTTIDLWPSFADVEDADNALTYAVTANTNPALFTSYTINDGRNLVLDYAPGASGTADLTVRATDTGSLFVATTFTVNVSTPGNRPPAIMEGTSVGVTMSEDGSPTAFNLTLHATDEDGDTLTWDVSDPADHGAATASGTGSSKSIGYTPDANYNGADSFTVRVTDGHGGLDTITVNVTIQPVNDAPVLDAIGNKAVDELSKLSFTAHATDVDGDDLTYSLDAGAPAGATIHTSSGVFSWTPTEEQGPGTYHLTVRVSDGSASDFEAITVTVAEVNTAPVAVKDTYVVDMNTSLVIPAELGVLANDSDVDGDGITASMEELPDVGELVLNADGSLTYTPETDFVGTVTFTYCAYDGKAYSEAALVEIVVTGIPVTGSTLTYLPIILKAP